MGARTRERSGGWAYVSMVSALPWFSMSGRRAIALQFVLFEAVAVVLGVWYARWSALALGTVAIAVASAGSFLMLGLSDRIRRLDLPRSYHRVLFDSSIDVVMGVLAFVALVTYLLVGPGSPGLLERFLGTPLPPLSVFFALIVAWDLCYRIGTGWWASVTGLWRTVAGEGKIDESTRGAYVRADLLTIGFASIQLLLVPFLRWDPLLALAVVGHVGAVMLVSGLSIVLLRAR